MTAKRSITSKMLVDVVLLLKELFGGDKYDFDLEDSTEAGIVWTRYPGQTATSYKSFRFHFEALEGSGWPALTEERLERWAVEPEVLWTFKKRVVTDPVGGSTLKALYGAPTWTVREVNLFRNAFRQHGIDSSPGPTATQLKSAEEK
jgi:hypothetical protein